MKRFLGWVTIEATMPFNDAALRLNEFLAPFVLCETDRFDEVPGFVASVDGLDFELQGIPDELAAEDVDRRQFVFTITGTMDSVGLLPTSLIGLPVGTAVELNGYADVSDFLFRKLREATSLECEVAR